ncbi:MAG: long-chain fatty acid--CoA ligase [Candidatus Omnitrophica bacterium]|nr:long-chain fatty acid--CoA ligase [Candidatus Omnitrophota bacterium]
MKVSQALIDNAKKYSQKPAIIFQDKPISFLQLKDSVFKLAQSFSGLGLKKSDKIAIYLPNCPQYFYSYLAVWSCGLTAVPLDFMLTEEEIISCLRHSEAKIIIMQPKSNISIENIRSNCPQLKEPIVSKEKTSGYLSLEKLIDKEKPLCPDVIIHPKDCAAIFYTSGSTGRPKGVLTNYLQIEAPAKAMVYFSGLNYKDISLCALPLSHLGGLVFVQGLVYLGSKVILMERFIP